ncbi:ABC-ATPase domain-containing protein, partial [Vibrio cholerae]|uniref:ABC-ATPase domain-containing protein n=1 Tax=Vibrio cholerae TaxID=666 RepID=UPI0020CE7D41
STKEIGEMLNALHQGVSKAVQSMNISQERGEKTALESVQIKESLAGISKAVSLIERMQALVSKGEEPITPLVDRIGQLRDDLGISTLVVMGGSGDYLDVADTVI